MVSTPMFHHLLLFSLLWLCFLLYVLWPYGQSSVGATPPQPTPPRRKRSRELQPFPGLIHKPLCDACERAGAPRLRTPPSPPPVLTFTRGRKRTLDTHHHFCPDQECTYYDWTGRVNSRANRHSAGKP